VDTILIWAGRVAGLAGTALVIAAMILRLMGMFWVAGVQVGSVLQLGIALAALGALSYAAVLVETRSRR